jgi:L-aspartate oxidase
VTIVTKRAAEESNTRYAQGGIAAVLGKDDTPEAHIKDTLVAGAGLCHEVVVEICAREGPDRIRELIARGADFDKDEHGRAVAHARGRALRAARRARRRRHGRRGRARPASSASRRTRTSACSITTWRST